MCLRRSSCLFFVFWLDFQNQKIQMLMSFYSRIFMDDFVPCLGSKPKTPLRSVGLSCSSSLFLVVQSRILVYTVMVFSNLDLIRPSVHHPLYSLPHGPREFLMASHILGVWPPTICCKFFFACRKDYRQKCRWPWCPGRRPVVAPYNSCYFA